MLRIHNVDVFYDNVQALRSVTIEVGEGELVALIGANGAGKSTTLKTISGLLRPRKGHIEFMGQQIDGLAPDKIVQMGIGHSPEGRHVWPDMSVWENLMMGAYLRSNRRETEQDLETVYEMFPILEERSKQKAGSLSGGEQQMLTIGRMLMGRPTLTMFDEPSLGLAPIIVEQTARTIREINQRGTTVLLVEQNAQMALSMADRAYVLETGQVTLEGTGTELLSNRHVRQAYLGI